MSGPLCWAKSKHGDALGSRHAAFVHHFEGTGTFYCVSCWHLSFGRMSTATDLAALRSGKRPE